MRVLWGQGMLVRGWLWLLVAVLAPFDHVRAELVGDWQNAANYPARVIAVHWENGHLDARTKVIFGAWTIGWGTSTKFAIDYHFPDRTRALSIGGHNPGSQAAAHHREHFHCWNNAVGERYCNLALYPKCQLLIYHTKAYLP